MSNVTVSIATSSTIGSFGAIADLSNAKAENRTFHYVGTAGAVIPIQGAPTNATTYMTEVYSFVVPPNGRHSWTMNDRSLYYRSGLNSGTGGGNLYCSYGEEQPATGPAGPITFGQESSNARVSTTDATATKLIGYTPAGDGAYTISAVITGVQETNELSYSARVLATFKKTGGTVTAEAITIEENTASLNPGTITQTVVGGEARINVVGIAATNINWVGHAAIQNEPAF